MSETERDDRSKSSRLEGPTPGESGANRGEMVRWGQRLRARRKSLKLPLKEIAATTGLSISYLAKLERGEEDALNPTRRVIDALRQTLRVPPPGGMTDWDAEKLIEGSGEARASTALADVATIAAFPTGAAARGQQVTALLFAAGPLSLAQICAALRCALFEAEEAIATACRQLAGSGLALGEANGIHTLCTIPELGESLREPLVALGKAPPVRVRLTPTQLEVLAIIAAHQPVTLGIIERIRGVSSERALHTLLDHGLIEETEFPAPGGRARQYRTTGRFLESFGLVDMAVVQRALTETRGF